MPSATPSESAAPSASQRPSEARIALVGIGTVSVMQITREAEAALRAASTFYVLHAQSLVLDYLRSEYEAEVIDLTPAYEEKKQRDETYRQVAQAVVAGASEGRGRRVAYVTSGHPLVLVTPSQLILRSAREVDIPVDIVPGVSSLDTVWADLRFDPGRQGVLMFEATSLLLRRYPLIPTVPLFLWQINSLETSLYSTRKNRPERFTGMKKYLLEYYPADHVAYLVHSASFPITRAEVVNVTVGELEELADVATSQHILYIPPVREQEIADGDLLARVTSQEHLAQLTEA